MGYRLRVLLLVLSVIAVSLSLVSSPVGAESFVVRLDDADDIGSAEGLRSHAETAQKPVVERINDEGGEVLRRFWLTNALLVEGEEKSSTEIRRNLSEDGYRVHDNYLFSPPDNVSGETTNSTTTSSDTNPKPAIEQMNVTPVWERMGVFGEGARVVVLDTGVEPSHQDIDLHTEDTDDPKYPGGWAEFDSEGNRVASEPYDSGVHGTHLSGTVAGGNESGTAIGVAPEAEVLHGKVFDGSATFAQILGGLEWAVKKNPDVLSLSFGVACTDSPVYTEGMVSPIRNAKATGAFVVASSGNSGDGCTSPPGNIYDSFTAGAVDSDGNVPEFSGGGKVNATEAWDNATRPEWPEEYLVPDVTAPGVGVLSSVPGGGGDRYRRLDGTSMATAHVSGVSALVEAATERDMLPIEHRAVLVETAEKPGGGDADTRHGVGVVDAYDAVKLAREQEKLENITPVNRTHLNRTDGGEATPLSGFGFVVALVASIVALGKKSSKRHTQNQ